MLTRHKHIETVLKYAEEVQRPLIRQQYEEAVRSRVVPEYMPVVIKNFCENLRSVLDYLSAEIRSRYGQTADSKQRCYFPLCDSDADFESVVAKLYPDLKSQDRELWDYLKNVQPFPGSDMRWLRQFNKLNNENKHFDLVLQTHEAVPVGDPRENQLGVIVHLDETKQEWVEFTFDGVGVNARVLLEEAFVGIREIADDVQAHLA